MKKEELRKRVLTTQRHIYSVAENEKVADQFINWYGYQNAKTVMLTQSFNTEIGTSRIINHALENGKTVYLPTCDIFTKELIPTQVRAYPDDMVVNHYGILIPKATCPVCEHIEDIDLVLVPGMAFTEQGNRLGYGGGFYDRFLKKYGSHMISASLTREALIYEELPTDHFDQKVDWIITEERIITI